MPRGKGWHELLSRPPLPNPTFATRFLQSPLPSPTFAIIWQSLWQWLWRCHRLCQVFAKPFVKIPFVKPHFCPSILIDSFVKPNLYHSIITPLPFFAKVATPTYGIGLPWNNSSTSKTTKAIREGRLRVRPIRMENS